MRTKIIKNGKIVLEKPENSFSRRLDKASLKEAYVSAIIARHGLYVQHNPVYHDNDFDLLTPDLNVWYDCSAKDIQIEVKGCQEHTKDETMFVCSSTSFNRKYGLTDFLPVPYVFVDNYGEIRALLPETKIHHAEHWDRDPTRNQVFMAAKAWTGDRISQEKFMDWLLKYFCK